MELNHLFRKTKILINENFKIYERWIGKLRIEKIAVIKNSGKP